MADKGIIFSAPMVRALLTGRKTQTRRLLKAPNDMGLTYVVELDDAPGWFGDEEGEVCFSSGYKPGDRLYVREAHHRTDDSDDSHIIGYDATPDVFFDDYIREIPGVGKCHFFSHSLGGWGGRTSRNFPSIHMPRWASRLWLAVTDVRVQRLQEIDERDALAEGIIEYEPTEDEPAEFSYRDGGDIWNNAVSAYAALWDSLHTEEGVRWQDNPWVVAVSFDVHDGNIDSEAA